MLRPQDDIYVTLASNVRVLPSEQPSNSKTVVATPMKVTGAWEVALRESHSPHQVQNYKATTLVNICTDEVQSDLPKSTHTQPYLQKASVS